MKQDASPVDNERRGLLAARCGRSIVHGVLPYEIDRILCCAIAVEARSPLLPAFAAPSVPCWAQGGVLVAAMSVPITGLFVAGPMAKVPWSNMVITPIGIARTTGRGAAAPGCRPSPAAETQLTTRRVIRVPRCAAGVSTSVLPLCVTIPA